MSSISADLYNDGRDDLALFYFSKGANYATLTQQIVSLLNLYLGIIVLTKKLLKVFLLIQKMQTLLQESKVKKVLILWQKIYQEF